MSCAVERCRAGAKDAAGDRRYPPAPVREAELPLRGRGGAPRAGGAQLLRGEPDEVRDTPQGGGRAGAPGDERTTGGRAPASRRRGTQGSRRSSSSLRSRP